MNYRAFQTVERRTARSCLPLTARRKKPRDRGPAILARPYFSAGSGFAARRGPYTWELRPDPPATVITTHRPYSTCKRFPRVPWHTREHVETNEPRVGLNRARKKSTVWWNVFLRLSVETRFCFVEPLRVSLTMLCYLDRVREHVLTRCARVIFRIVRNACLDKRLHGRILMLEIGYKLQRNAFHFQRNSGRWIKLRVFGSHRVEKWKSRQIIENIDGLYQYPGYLYIRCC